MSRNRQENPITAISEVPETELPAVGLIATQDNTDWLASELLRISKAGYRTIVISPTEQHCEGLEYAEMVNAAIVEPLDVGETSQSVRERLATVARERGFPGLLFHADTSGRIDLDASHEAIKSAETFAVDAPTEPPVDPDPTVLVGIPAYNESATIGPVVRAARRSADEVLVVDDGSDDDTGGIAEEAGAAVVSHRRNSGYGASLQTIFEQAELVRADHLVVLDADGQHSAGDVPKLVETQRETDADLVIGCRFGAETETEMPPMRRLGVGVVNALTNLSLGVVRSESRIRDTQSGFRAYNREAIQTLANDDSIGDHMDASTNILYLAHSNDFDIREVQTTIDYEVDDQNSLNPVMHGVLLMKNIIRIIERERPITLLGVPGVLCVLFGFGFGYWTVSNYLQSETFPVGLAVIATGLTTVGILTALAGVILHSLEVYRH